MGIVDIFGFIGAALSLYAFWRNSNGSWRSPSLAYAVCNLIAAFILTGYSFYKSAFANVALNVVWGFVAVMGIFVYRKQQNKKR